MLNGMLMSTRADSPRPASLDRARAALRPHLPELTRRRAWIYWTDLLGTSFLAWSALVTGAAVAAGTFVLSTGERATLGVVLFVLSTLMLYRASAFLHEVAHVRGSMPGFAAAWDALIGVPLLMPSLVYDRVHMTHHDRSVFGTAADPEYVPGEGGHGHHGARLAAFAIVPLHLFVRWGIVTPLSLLHPGVRRFAVERLSSLASNPSYRRPIPEGREGRRWWALELACAGWCLAVTAAALFGLLPLAALAFALGAASVVSILHGVRSFATHRFDGGGASRTLDEQFLDSVNVTGHPLVTELWAPLGLRYHALHHLAPRLPYHALGRAHGLLLATLPADDPYRWVTFDSLSAVIAHVSAAAPVPSPVACEATACEAA